MKKLCRLLRAATVTSILFVIFSIGFPSNADAQSAHQVLLDLRQNTGKQLVPTSEQVTTTRSQAPALPGIVVTILPGKDSYPGISIKPERAAWNLSPFGHVEAHLVNTGIKPLSIALRVDNAGDWKNAPWNTESLSLNPGQSGTITTIFGYAYGHKPSYALKPAAVVNLMLFTGSAESVQSFRLESLIAGGPAGETPVIAPEDVRLNPKGGVLLNTADKITSQNAQASLAGLADHQTLQIVFPAATTEHSVSVQPSLGRWDLRDYLEVRVRVRNEGLTPVTPRVRLESNGGVSDWKTTATPLKPGAVMEIAIPFAGAATTDLSRQETGSHVTSDAVAAVTVAADGTGSEQKLRVESLRAVRPLTPTLPAWLGQRPPAAGAWVKTLDEEFSGSTLDSSIWSVYGDNYWDKQTHWSKADVLLGGGLVRLRYEKKTGFSNDDPAQKPSDYAAGYLHTYDKWAQRYGYFEARMKLPTAPGLWPAFWMMPDRGTSAGPEQWKRQDTGNGGMEFDIMEHLTRWGPHRYNIAMHYDGYGADHKSVGSDKIYVQPDKDGFLTCGLLWTPGLAVYYCNGREVLRWKNARVSQVPAMLMFTLPMGGWDNSPLQDARLPDQFVIDYVRVWQRKDLVSPTDGKKTVAIRK